MRGEGAAPPSCRRHEKTADGCPRRSHPSRKGEASSAQRFPALGAARVQDLATSFRCHARAEAVAPLADQVRRLICALRHRLSPSKRPGFGPQTFRSPVSKSIHSPSQRCSPSKSAIIRTRNVTDWAMSIRISRIFITRLHSAVRTLTFTSIRNHLFGIDNNGYGTSET